MSWKKISLREISSGGLMIDGDWIESKDQDPKGAIRLIQLADIGDGFFVDKSSRFINQETAERLKCTFIESGDILIARMPDPIGRACVFPLEGKNKFVTAVDVCILRVRGGADPRYVMRAINSEKFRSQITAFSTGTTRQRISRKNLESLSIPLPPLAIQKQIADTLDKADALRRKDQELLTKYDELAQSIFYEMFGDPVVNEKGWKACRLIDVCSKITDGTHDTPARLTEGVKFITGKHIRPGVIDYDNSDYVTEEVHKEIYRRCNPVRGDVLYTNIGVNYGTAAINTVEYEFSMKNVALLKPNNEMIDGYYLQFMLNSPSYKNRMTSTTGIGGAQQFLSLKQIKDFTVNVPSYNLQLEFKQKMEAIRNSKTFVLDSTQQSHVLFSTLLNQYFN